jgi:pyruvate dehydrogenase E1 component beta subunit
MIAGAAFGAAIGGLRPVADIMFADFIADAYDEICLKAGRFPWIQNREGGIKLPIVYRMTSGGYSRMGCEHSGIPYSVIKHNPGLKIIAPSNAYDAKGLLKTAIRDDNPVVFFDHVQIGSISSPVPEEEYTIPFGQARIVQEGTDVTVVAISYMQTLVGDANRKLLKKGIKLEIIDPRTLEPLDINTILASVHKTGRLVIVDEDTEACGFSAEIAFQVMEKEFYSLKAPIRRVNAKNVPIAASPELEDATLPSEKEIIAAIEAVMKE